MAEGVTKLLQLEGVNYYISIPNQIAYPYWKYCSWIGKILEN